MNHKRNSNIKCQNVYYTSYGLNMIKKPQPGWNSVHTFHMTSQSPNGSNKLHQNKLNCKFMIKMPQLGWYVVYIFYMWSQCQKDVISFTETNLSVKFPIYYKKSQNQGFNQLWYFR